MAPVGVKTLLNFGMIFIYSYICSILHLVNIVMATALYTDYFTFAHNETRNSVPNGVRTHLLNFLSKYKKGLIHYLRDLLIQKVSNDFVTLNLEFEGIYAKILNETISFENVESDYNTMKKIVTLLTQADEIFSEINYLENQQLEKEIKNTLHTSYLIEVELKSLVFKRKPRQEVQKDDLFELVSLKSKESILESL